MKLPFFSVFSAYAPTDETLLAQLATCMVTDMRVDPASRTIIASLLPEAPFDAELMNRLSIELAAAYGVTAAILQQGDKQEKPSPKAKKPTDDKEKCRPGTAMYGQVRLKSVTPISDLNLDMGTVLIEGDVFAVDHKDLRNRTDKVVRFDITDYTGSVRVTQFMTQQESSPIIKHLKVGQHLLVQGRLTMDRFENDMVLQPTGILYGKKTARQDTADQKRVELHLHTRMSAMDALTDTKAVVQQAAAWGHRAIAITDHGVAHSFPDAAGGAKGTAVKVLYGVEAYFMNDVDGALAVHGPADLPLDCEYVVFDIETTGFDNKRDAIIEIGAVVLKNGVILEEKFSTFADPKRALSPKIVSLTGITDEMLEGAPTQDAAVSAFLQFAAGRPLVAHNADFDIGFITQAAQRMGVPFHPTTVDTLALGRRLFPELHNHKLDTIAKHLRLEDFNHHRAYDDAATAALILARELELLTERGVTMLDKVDEELSNLKAGGKTQRSPYHLIVLAKNQTGLRNLYKLVSASFLDHYSRVPIMPKSLINENREGLIIGSACEAGELFKAVVAGKTEEELLRIADWYDYLEIQPTSNNAFMLRPGRDGRQAAQSVEDLRDFNRAIVALGDKAKKPVCATGDVHFLNPEDEIYRHILLDSKGFDDADSPNPLYFKTTDEMLEEFSYLGAETAHRVVVENTNLIADWCDAIQPLPKGLFPPKLENSAEELSNLVWGKAKALYGEEPPQIVVDRINAELGDIIKCKYDVIYMSAQKLVQNSLEHGYLVGSRGSVGSSLVAFMSGITEVNSLAPHYRCPQCKHSDFDAGEGFGCGADMPDEVCPICGAQYVKDGFNIPFETFLGFGGDKVPDIDLNFSGEYQSKAHRYTFELFGESHVFRAGTIGTVAAKTAYGYVKKYLEKRFLTATKAEENRLALGCTGVKRTTGQHPGGMVVIPQDREIYDFCPVQYPADKQEGNMITTHFEYHS
ncbi:MAG: PolC-type DNA polymerase III, partial [Oscillospiraceae bacterium]